MFYSMILFSFSFQNTKDGNGRRGPVDEGVFITGNEFPWRYA